MHGLCLKAVLHLGRGIVNLFPCLWWEFVLDVIWSASDFFLLFFPPLNIPQLSQNSLKCFHSAHGNQHESTPRAIFSLPAHLESLLCAELQYTCTPTEWALFVGMRHLRSSSGVFCVWLACCSCGTQVCRPLSRKSQTESESPKLGTILHSSMNTISCMYFI